MAQEDAYPLGEHDEARGDLVGAQQARMMDDLALGREDDVLARCARPPHVRHLSVFRLNSA